MRIVLFDLPEDRIKLYPLTLTRPTCYLRVGILTLIEKWQHDFPDAEISIATDTYLSPKFGLPNPEKSLWVHSGLIPDAHVLSSLKSLEQGEKLVYSDKVLAFWGTPETDLGSFRSTELKSIPSLIARPWDIFQKNGEEIKNDYRRVTSQRNSQPVLDKHTICYGKDIFLEPGATVKAAMLNAETGPIYIGKNAQVQEGALIRGPFSLGENSIVAMGAKVRGDTTVGPASKIGGEVSNCVVMGYSNKGHDGFLGNSVIGEWCNIGAGTNNSNLKNNYDKVKFWDYETSSFMDSGLQFCGLIMGDHSKTGISTMFNTGSSVGVSSNIFGSGFPRTYIPSFAWGGASGFTTYKISKAMESADRMMQRRNLSLSPEDKAILNHIFEHFSS